MIYGIKGKIENIENGRLYVDVNDIVYEVIVGDTSEFEEHINEKIMIFTKMIVNDDGVTLYGFSNVSKLKLFEKLISVNKLGPKSALKILSSNSVESIVSAIMTGDVKTLSKLPGIGPKTAERIVMELKDSIKELDINISEEDKKSIEAIEALVALGFNRNQAKKAVSKVMASDDKLDSIIKKALRILSR